MAGLFFGVKLRGSREVPLLIHQMLFRVMKKISNTFHTGQLSIIFFGDFLGKALKLFFSSFNQILNSKSIPNYFGNSTDVKARFSVFKRANSGT